MPSGNVSFIYHAVPINFIGDTLFPLFQLKNLYPEIYNEEVKKYDDHPQRKLLPFKQISLLDCQRGDVLHCSSIHPSLVLKALKTVFPDGNKSVKFFKIPMNLISPGSAVLFDMNRPGYVFGQDEPENVFDLIDPMTYKEIQIVPEQAIEFFKEWKQRGERGAPAWGKIPHVFVKSSIFIKGFKIIDWRD